MAASRYAASLRQCHIRWQCTAAHFQSNLAQSVSARKPETYRHTSSRIGRALLTSDLLLVVAVARVFRRGDFPCDRHPNPLPGKTGTSYNFGAIARAKFTALHWG